MLAKFTRTTAGRPLRWSFLNDRSSSAKYRATWALVITTFGATTKQVPAITQPANDGTRTGSAAGLLNNSSRCSNSTRPTAWTTRPNRPLRRLRIRPHSFGTRSLGWIPVASV